MCTTPSIRVAFITRPCSTMTSSPSSSKAAERTLIQLSSTLLSRSPLFCGISPTSTTRFGIRERAPEHGPRLFDDGPARAAFQMIVHQTHGLHERINRRRSHKRPTPPLQVLAQRDGLRCPRKLHECVSRQAPRARPRVWFPAPEVRRQRSELLADCGSAPGVVDRRFDLAAMTDDSLVAEQSPYVAGVEPRDAVDIEIREGVSEVRTFAENRQPAQTGLESFEADLFEQPPVLGDGNAPFIIVITPINLILTWPPAACDAIGVMNQAGGRRHAPSIAPTARAGHDRNCRSGTILQFHFASSLKFPR